MAFTVVSLRFPFLSPSSSLSPTRSRYSSITRSISHSPSSSIQKVYWTWKKSDKFDNAICLKGRQFACEVHIVNHDNMDHLEYWWHNLAYRRRKGLNWSVKKRKVLEIQIISVLINDMFPIWSMSSTIWSLLLQNPKGRESYRIQISFG